MFNREAIPQRPDFQMRRGGAYKTYESPQHISLACGRCLLVIKNYAFSAGPSTECFSMSSTN